MVADPELPAGVPGLDVPRLAEWLAVALPDAGAIGAPFFVMDFVEGRVLRTVEDAVSAGVSPLLQARGHPGGHPRPFPPARHGR